MPEGVSAVISRLETFGSGRQRQGEKLALVRDIGVLRNGRFTHSARSTASPWWKGATAKIIPRGKTSASKTGRTVRAKLAFGRTLPPGTGTAGHLHPPFLVQEIDSVEILPIGVAQDIVMRNVGVEIPRCPPFETVPGDNERFRG